MANIDPELQNRLNAVVAGFSVACCRMRNAAENVSLAMRDLSFEIDGEALEVAKEAASRLINRAGRRL